MSFVATYHLNLKHLDKLIKKITITLIYDSEAQRVFSPASKVSCRSAKKTNDYIVRSKLYPIERKVENSRCSNPKCQVSTIIQVTYTFSSFVKKTCI